MVVIVSRRGAENAVEFKAFTPRRLRVQFHDCFTQRRRERRGFVYE